jgi:hypothetical protein
MANRIRGRPRSRTRVQRRWDVSSIGIKFSGLVGMFAILFAALVVCQTWYATKQNLMRLTENQAELALAFDVAVREYAAESIRPEMAKRIPPDEFVVEAMSTSYIARSVFEKVNRSFSDYVIKFSSENPRNVNNVADQGEAAILAFFARIRAKKIGRENSR